MRPSSSLAFLALCACWQVPDLPVPVQPPVEQMVASRGYGLLTPDGGDAPDGGQTWPLLVLLHAYAATGSDTLAFLQLDSPAVRSRYFVALPRGLPEGGAIGWNPVATPEPPWDSAYVQGVIDDVLAHHPIDRSRIFAVGHSQGAHMAYRLACDDAGRISAVVGVAGQLLQCAPSRPVSVLALHGTNDTVIRYRANGAEPGAVDTVTTWAHADGCTGALGPTGVAWDLSIEDGNETTLQAFAGCPAGIDVQLGTMDGVPHVPWWNPGLDTTITGFLEAHARQ